MKTMRVLVLGVLAAAAWAAPAGVVWAGKPGGGGGAAPPGTIFFVSGSSVCSMDGSGANVTVLGLSVGSAGTYRPSRRLHGGARWFLHLESVPGQGPGPGGNSRSDLFAVREDGGVRVRLTSDPMIQYEYNCDWGADENASGASIAVVGARWTGTSPTDTVIPGTVGVYTAHLAFDAGGTVVGLDAEPTLASPLPSKGRPGREFSDTIGFFSWSPDMARIALNRYADPASSQQVWIADLATGAVTPIGLGERPNWSPDGSKIACSRLVRGSLPSKDATVIETLRPDGSGRTTVVSVKVRVSASVSQYISTPRWSPDGTHIAYQHLLYDHFSTGQPSDVYRVATDGSGVTNLTPGSGSDGMILLDWRW